MKIQYLGTAAAEGFPALFCSCENCKKASRLGGRNIRTRSQALIDDRILIDFPADTYAHFLRFSVPMCDIRTCLITHAHTDHLYPDDFFMRLPGFSHAKAGDPLKIYLAAGGKAYTDRRLADLGLTSDDYLKTVEIRPGVSFDAEGYRILPVRASHAPDSDPLLFVIEKDGKSLFYANDTGELSEESMKTLKAIGHPLDVISLDCTFGCSDDPYPFHLSFDRCKAVRELFKSEGIADEHTVFVLNHFTHNGKEVVYDEFEPIARASGFLTAYDGMILDF